MKKLIFVLILLFSIDITHRLLLLLPFTWFKSEVKDTVVEPVVQDDLLDKSKESILKWLQDVRATFEVEKRKMGILFYRRNYSDSKYGKWGWYKDGDERVNDKYVGEIKNGKPNGQGTHTLPDGRKFVGKFKDGKSNGQGILTFPNGNKYEGEWKDGKRHGQGTYTFSDGRKYVGEWRSGEKHGQGTYTWSNGEKYVGEWKDGKRHGQGTYTFGKGKWEGDKYEGEWKKDEKHGQGKYTTSSGRKYIGEWKDGEIWKGTHFDKDGNVIGKFVNGKEIKQ